MSSALEALRELAMPVVIVAARDAAGPCGATATVMYTSLEPVELVVSLTASSRTAQAALVSQELSVSLLGGGQEDIAVRVSRHSDAADKFADLDISTVVVDGFDAPAVAGTTAFWGRLVDTMPSGDHLVMRLRVEHVHLTAEDETLVRLDRSYTVARRQEPADETYPL